MNFSSEIFAREDHFKKCDKNFENLRQVERSGDYAQN